MKKLIKFTVILGVMACTFGSLLAQNTVSKTGSSTGTVVTPITLTWEQPLAFGQIVPSNTDGTACIGVTGLSVPSSDKINETPVCVNCTALSTSEPNAYGGNKFPGPAVFEVTGQKNWHFAITLPANTVVCHLIDLNPGGAPDLLVSSFTAVVGSPGVVGTHGTLSVGIGIMDFAVGGTLTVPANATPGRYQGAFSVSVNYD